MKKVTLLVVCAIGFLSAEWIKILGTSETPLPPKKVVIASDTTLVFIRIENYGFIQENINVNGIDFKRIGISEERIGYDTTNIGKPEIPYIRLRIAVPDSTTFNITVNPLDDNLYNDYTIYPVPQIVFESDSSGGVYSKEVFAYDGLFYQKDTLYPNKFYEIRSDGHWRDQRVLEILLYPVQYNPQQELMYFYTRMDVRIEYLGMVAENPHGLGPFDDLGRDILLNYPVPSAPSLIDNQSHPIDTNYVLPPQPIPVVRYYTNLLDTTNYADYIIVTHHDFLNDSVAAQWINDFAAWRAGHSRIDVGIVDIMDIYDQFYLLPDSMPLDSSGLLKEFLQYAYNNWRARFMADGHFAYCLFIGDWDYVPIESITVNYSGLWFWNAYEGYFRDLTSGGDCEDIMLGRWPVKATKIQDLVTIAQKTINYEKYPCLGNWRRRGLLIAGLGGFNSYVNASTLCFTDINYDTLTIRCNDPVITNILFPETVQTYLNRGEIIAAFYGHGGYNNWGGNPGTNAYRRYSAETLQNNDSLSVVLSYACCPGSFHWDHPYFDTIFPSLDDTARICLGDAFLTNPNGGAVAFYGATSPIWTDEYNTEPTERMLRYQEWILGKMLINSTSNAPSNCFCLLGDPALDLGDYTAYPNLPDLIVRPQGIDISLLPPYPYQDNNDSIPIKASIWNIGGHKANNVEVKFTVKTPDANHITLLLMTIPEILPRDSIIITAYWQPWLNFPNYSEIGDCEFIVEVDPERKINESWEFNNTSSATTKIAIYPNQPGWPKKITGCKQPAIADIEGNGSAEVVCPGLDSIYVFDKDGNNYPNWPQYFHGVQSVVLGDINNDQKIEIIAVASASYVDSVKVYNWQGSALWARSLSPCSVSLYVVTRPPSLGRIANSVSPYLDVVVIGDPGNTPQGDSVNRQNGPFIVFVYSFNGDSLYAFESDLIVAQYGNFNPASISDINGDQKQEIVVSSVGVNGGKSTTIYNKDGLVATLDCGSSHMTPALAKIDNDAWPDIITGGNDGKIRAYNMVTNTLLWQTQTEGPINSSPAVGNINPLVGYDGNEITFGNDASRIHAKERVHGWDWYPWPFEADNIVRTSAALANLDGNQGLDIVIGASDQYVYGLDYNKEPISPFPLPLFGQPSSPVIGDIDHDGIKEIIISSSDGYLHVWKNMNRNMPIYSRLDWPQVHHDYQRTGWYSWMR